MGILRRGGEDLADIYCGNYTSIYSFLPSSRKMNDVGASTRAGKGCRTESRGDISPLSRLALPDRPLRRTHAERTVWRAEGLGV